MKKIAGLVVEKKDEKWQIRIWGPWRLVAMALMLLWLMALALVKTAPEWSDLLWKLIDLVL